MLDWNGTIKRLQDSLKVINGWCCRTDSLDDPIANVERAVEDALDLLKEHESIVRCKDCKHRPIKPNECISGFDLAFVDDVCPCHCDDPYYSWYPPDDWYCANGERR